MADREKFNGISAATLEAFEQLGSLTSNVEILSKFIGEMFDPPRDELEIADLTDWSPNPTLLSTIRDPNYQGWAADLNEIWKKLGRRVRLTSLPIVDYKVSYSVFIPIFAFRLCSASS